ncbi:MAG: hypothetical protein ACRDZO_21995 [Egibacteraceae bacterium]
MNANDETELRTQVGELVAEWHTGRHGSLDETGPAELLELVTASHVVADEAALVRHRWVSAARRGGASWSDVGTALGVSRQAAQQRFPDPTEAGGPLPATRVVRATAADEMMILHELEKDGYHLVGFGAFRLSLERSDHPWQHKRVAAARRTTVVNEHQAAGWQYVGSWFPWHYFKRPATDD